MKRFALYTVMIFATTFFVSCKDDDDNNNNTSLSETDKDFMTRAGHANLNEVDFGQMALSKSTNDTVKAFAQMMVNDHTMGYDELDSIADKVNHTLPTTIDATHAALKTQLMALSGYSFDTAYMNGQVRDHTSTIALFQNEANSGNNVSVKGFAVKHIPHLQMHLHAADSIANAIK